MGACRRIRGGKPQALILDQRLARVWVAVSTCGDHEDDDENDWRVLEDGAWQSGNSEVDSQQRFLKTLSLQRFAEVTVKSQPEESLFVPFERFCCQGEN